MRLILISLVCVGCGSEAHGGAGCPCGDDEVCDATDPAGPTCIAATGDLDGDGIPNAMDFCDHAAGGLYDEDGDGIGDDCDPCPIAPPPSSPDADGDAVDRPCDPDPDMPGDHILLFDGFHSLAATWHATTPGAWRIEGGELVASLTAQGEEDYLKTTVVGADNTAIEVSYRIDALGTSSVTHAVAVAASDPRPAGVASLECGVAKADSSSNGVVDLQTNQNTASTPTLRGAFDTPSLYVIGAYASGGDVGCTAIGDGQGIGTVQAPITPDALATIAIGARAVTARFQWVLVIGR